MHAREIHTPLTRSVNRPRSRERATDGGRKRSGPEQDPEEACPRLGPGRQRASEKIVLHQKDTIGSESL
jgi:hypothetical protein